MKPVLVTQEPRGLSAGTWRGICWRRGERVRALVRDSERAARKALAELAGIGPGRDGTGRFAG